MPRTNMSNILWVVLTIIGAIALITVLGIWLMQFTMMGAMMNEMMGGEMMITNMGFVSLLLGLLVAAGVIAVILLFVRRSH